ncbi:MAG: hypothetical protein IJX25_01960 [Clostridia bacterium]|nr:hypothetical protein [Clostridia bacterium]MBQ8792906.1 hypothetical protein [Clostridia bacterium]
MAKFSQFKSSTPNGNVSEEQIRDKYNEYKDMSKQQLNQTLLSEVAKQKANGTFDYSQLESMVNSLQGVLPAKDYENIRSMLESLK